MKKAAIIVVVLWIASVGGSGGGGVTVNGKVGYRRRKYGGRLGQKRVASASVPVTSNVGFQADWLYTDVSDREF